MTFVPSRPGCGATFFRTLRRHAALALLLAAFPAASASAEMGNEARIDQIGDENYVILYQLGSGNVGTVVQDGGANAAWLGQQALPGMMGVNSAGIIQSGAQNFVIAWQTLDGGESSLLSSDMHLYIFQQGDGNYAESIQTGWANDGSIAQFGDGNWASLQQTGSLLTSSIVQTGSGLNATSIQIGAGSLPVSIQQTGDGAPSVVITQQ